MFPEPSEPQNLIYRWKGNNLVLAWNHPKIPNGNITAFDVFKSKNYLAHYRIDEQKFQYTREVSLDVALVSPDNL